MAIRIDGHSGVDGIIDELRVAATARSNAWTLAYGDVGEDAIDEVSGALDHTSSAAAGAETAALAAEGNEAFVMAVVAAQACEAFGE